jgi:hypothetical protein
MDNSKTVVVLVCLKTGDNSYKRLISMPFHDRFDCG